MKQTEDYLDSIFENLNGTKFCNYVWRCLSKTVVDTINIINSSVYIKTK